MLNEIVCQYGIPTCIHSDQGANLRSAVIQSLCQLLGITTTRTSAYHPEGNGQVERFNRTVEAILAKVVDSDQHDWDSHLPKALFAYWTAIHESTNFPPTISTLVDHLSSPYRSDAWPSATEYDTVLSTVCAGISPANKATQAIVRENLQSQHLRRKSLHDRQGIAKELQVGDRVWLYNPRVPQGSTKKFISMWKGPYTVTGAVNYKVQLIGGSQTFVVHRNRLKLCYTPPQQSQLRNQRNLPTVTLQLVEHHLE